MKRPTKERKKVDDQRTDDPQMPSLNPLIPTFDPGPSSTPTPDATPADSPGGGGYDGGGGGDFGGGGASGDY